MHTHTQSCGYVSRKIISASSDRHSSAVYLQHILINYFTNIRSPPRPPAGGGQKVCERKAAARAFNARIWPNQDLCRWAVDANRMIIYGHSSAVFLNAVGPRYRPLAPTAATIEREREFEQSDSMMFWFLCSAARLQYCFFYLPVYVVIDWSKNF